MLCYVVSNFQISTGNSNHICVPGRLSIAFLDLRMTENDGASEAVRFRALGQEPVSVEYADWSEEVLVSLSPLGNQRGKAVVIDLLDDSVNATFDGAITEEGAAIWHPGGTTCYFCLPGTWESAHLYRVQHLSVVKAPVPGAIPVRSGDTHVERV